MSEDSVTIYYWPIAFRGNFLKLICEEAKFPYKNGNMMQNLDLMQAKGHGKADGIFFAPPIIQHGDFQMSQMTACAVYLANVCKLLPEGGIKAEAMALKILNDCNDIYDEVTRSGGHYESYWTPELYFEWVTNRLKCWFKILENTLKQNNGIQDKADGKSEIYFVGKKVSYADLAVLQVTWSFIKYINMQEFIENNFPNLYIHYTQMSQRPGPKKLFDEQKNTTFCGGITETELMKAVKAFPALMQQKNEKK